MRRETHTLSNDPESIGRARRLCAQIVYQGGIRAERKLHPAEEQVVAVSSSRESTLFCGGEVGSANLFGDAIYPVVVLVVHAGCVCNVRDGLPQLKQQLLEQPDERRVGCDRLCTSSVNGQVVLSAERKIHPKKSPVRALRRTASESARTALKLKARQGRGSQH